MTTGTHISYLHICHRKLWLFAHGLSMEQTSDLVAEGKLIDENSYAQRADRWQQLAIEGIRIDHFDAKLGIVREVKKSNRKEQAHVAQVKYYMFVLERNGIVVNSGVLEYPKLRLKEEVWLTDDDRQNIPKWEETVSKIIAQEFCPSTIDNSTCKRCAYFDFCYAGEITNS